MDRATAFAPGGLPLESFSRVVEGIYAAALNPSLWPSALAGIASLHDCPAVHLLTPTIDPTPEGWDAAATPREGHVFLSGEASPGVALEATFFYLDYLRRVGVGNGGFCAGVVFDGSHRDLVATSCALFRGREGRAFNQQDKEVHRLTIRHLSHALGTMYRLRDAEMKVAASTAALDRLATGVLLLGERGNVLFANRSALDLLAAEDGIRLRNGMLLGDDVRLSAARPDEQRRLEDAIREACGASPLPRNHFSKGIAIGRPSGRPPVVVQLAALAPANGLSPGPRAALAIAFIGELDGVPRLDSVLLAGAFGLSPAECLLAQALVAGQGLRAAARQLGVSPNTVKTQLQGIFQKTQTSRQAELVRLLVGAASVRGGAPGTLGAATKPSASMMSVMVMRAAAKPRDAKASRGRAKFPRSPLTLTVGFAPGGATDVFARIVARKLADQVGEAVTVENLPGNGGSAGWHRLATAEPDGYTLHVAGVEGFAASSLALPEPPYKALTEFAPVIMGAVSPIIYVVPASSPADSLGEFLARAKRRPGELSYASPGSMTSNHLAGALLASRAGVVIRHVPYMGGGPAMVDLLGGRVSMYPAQIPTSKLHVGTGRLRALASAGATRISLMPGVATVAEQGYPGFDVKTTYAFFAARRVPAERLDFWNREIAGVLADPEVRAQLAAQGLEAAGGSREELEAYLKVQVFKWRSLVRDCQVSLE